MKEIVKIGLKAKIYERNSNNRKSTGKDML